MNFYPAGTICRKDECSSKTGNMFMVLLSSTGIQVYDISYIHLLKLYTGIGSYRRIYYLDFNFERF